MRTVSALLIAGVLCAACSSSGEEPVSVEKGPGTPGTPDDTEVTNLRAPYPEAPYGTKVGAVIENLRFLGWQSPSAANLDTENLELVTLANFYDPQGEKGNELIVITSTAVWCAVCRLEYDDFRGKVQTYSEKGVVFLGALFEDNQYGVARPSDLRLWADNFDVEFPFVLDPGFKLGAFFDREATPMTMIIDAKTMRIEWIETGWAVEGQYSLWATLDRSLGS